MSSLMDIQNKGYPIFIELFHKAQQPITPNKHKIITLL
jgi:hypothetical protein